jgi:hypothetical protein
VDFCRSCGSRPRSWTSTFRSCGSPRPASWGASAHCYSCASPGPRPYDTAYHALQTAYLAELCAGYEAASRARSSAAPPVRSHSLAAPYPPKRCFSPLLCFGRSSTAMALLFGIRMCEGPPGTFSYSPPPPASLYQHLWQHIAPCEAQFTAADWCRRREIRGEIHTYIRARSLNDTVRTNSKCVVFFLQTPKRLRKK